MENREAFWDNIYHKNLEKADSDAWPDCYLHLIKKNDRIIEFGCGEGYLSEKLLKKGFNVLSTDISEEALTRLKTRVPDASVQKVDFSQPLPFEDHSFNIIAADLCLHYFSSEETKEIVSECSRILKPGGFLLARVNSDKDINYGAGSGIEIEKGFFNQNGHYKRFFNREMAVEFFKNWKELSVSENTSSKYDDIKHVIEIIASSTAV